MQISGNMALSVTAAADEYGSGRRFVLANVLLTVQQGESFQALAETLVYWVVAAAGKETVSKKELDGFVVTDDYLAGLEAYFEEAALAVTPADAVDFMERFFCIRIEDSLRAYAGLGREESINGVYFPLPPAVELSPGYDQTGEEPWYSIADYNDLAPGALAVFREIFQKLAVTVEEESQGKPAQQKQERLKQAGNGMSVGALLFADWFSMAVKHVVRQMRFTLKKERLDACAFAELLRLLEKQGFYTSLSGLLSRYSLHGLRLPAQTEEKGGFQTLIVPAQKGLWVTQREGALVLPKEAGATALAGQAFLAFGGADGKTPLTVGLRSKTCCLSLPRYFSLALSETDGSAAAARQIASHMGRFALPYEMPEVQAAWIPAVFSFASPMRQQESWIWRIPQGLLSYFLESYAVSPRFTFALAKHGETMETRKISVTPLYLMEFSLRSTGTDGTYIIETASAQDISMLETLVTEKPDIRKLCLFSAETADGTEQPFLAVSQLNPSAKTRPPQEGEALLACAQRYDAQILVRDPADFIPQEAARRYCSSIRMLAQENGGALLNPRTKWDFTDVVSIDKGTARLVSFQAVPKESETLLEFAKRNGVTAAQALFMNRGKTSLFAGGQKLCVPVQAGFWAGSASEQTKSAVNERYIFTRAPLPAVPEPKAETYAQAVLENNYSLLRFGMTGTKDVSSPASFQETDGQIQYDLAVAADAYMGGGYRSVGKLVCGSLEWLDYYGNRLLSPIPTARAVGYQDALLSLSKWESISAFWQPKQYCGPGPLPDADAPFAVEVVMRFAAENYMQDDRQKIPRQQLEQKRQLEQTQQLRQKQWGNAVKLYSRLKRQLADEHVHVYLRCSLFAGYSQELDKDALLRMADTILAFLRKAQSGECRLGEESTAPMEFTICGAFEKSRLTKESLVPLECALAIKRAGKADWGYEECKELLDTETIISVPQDLRAFDTRLRQALPGTIALKSGGASSISAFRAADLTLRTAGQRVFLPAPFSNTLASCDDVQIRPYADGAFGADLQKRSLRGIDLNLWMKHALQCMDQMFSPEIAGAARLAGCDYNGLLDVKIKLADKLSGMLVSPFADPKDAKEPVPEPAKEAFLQNLYGSLASYFTTKAVVSFTADVCGLPEYAVLYGTLSDADGLFTYSDVRLQAGEKNTCAFTISGQETVIGKNGAVLSGMDVGPWLQVSQIESGITPVPGTDGFHASAWHSGITENLVQMALCGDQVLKVPFPLDTFPEMPQLTAQEAEQEEENESLWRYAFTYSRSYHFPQQSVRCRVNYNVGKQAEASDLDAGFVAVLAQAEDSAEAVLCDLTVLASKICQSTCVRPQEELAQKYRDTFQCAYQIFSALASVVTLQNSGQNNGPAASGGISFTITESDDVHGRFCMAITEIETDGIQVKTAARPDRLCQNTQEPLRIETLHIEPRIAGYEAVETAEHTWMFYKDAIPLSCSAGQAIHKRTIIMPRQEILQYQNAAAQIRIQQNTNLCGRDMDKSFVFTTGTLAFDAPASGCCKIRKADLAPDREKGRSLSGRLARYLAGLCGGASVQMEASCRYTCAMYEGLSAVSFPVFLQIRTALSAANAQETADTWARRLAQWRKDFPSVEFSKKERISFTLLFYSDYENIPLLVVEELFLDGEYVQL